MDVYYRSMHMHCILADRTNGRDYATVLCPSVVCNVKTMYCG